MEICVEQRITFFDGTSDAQTKICANTYAIAHDSEFWLFKFRPEDRSEINRSLRILFYARDLLNPQKCKLAV
jgi:hypothetical protein